MKKYLIWKNNQKLLAATSLKVVNQPSSFNMALHVNDDVEKVIENREQLPPRILVSICIKLYSQSKPIAIISTR